MDRLRSARVAVRAWLADVLPRWLAVLLRIRRLTPEGRYWPLNSVYVEPIDADTGGAFRAAWRMQDPAKDPKEPNGGESSAAGNDHGWSGCTCTSAALAIAYQAPQGSLALWGGDIRHRQGDLSGGTDLYDVRDAWKAYGETLTIRSGAGWSGVKADHNAGRAIVIQGIGNVPGSESFDGGHACCIAPETHADGRWLFGDPLATGWQWIAPADIERWAEAWQSSVAFAVGDLPASSSSPPPTPAPAPCPPCPDPAPMIAEAIAYAGDLAELAAQDAAVSEWIAWLDAGAPNAADVWDAGAWSPADPDLVAVLEADCTNLAGARWSRGPLPDPVAAAYHALTAPAVWDAPGWRAVLWQ
jgi:hypothetical protein